jgi:hypothetical protein
MIHLICAVSIERHGPTPSGFTLRLYDAAGPMVGSIMWVNFAGHGVRLPRECEAEKRALLADQGLSRSTPMFYGHTEGLDRSLQGMGLGQWMLAESARIAWVMARAGIMQDKCRGGYNSDKSRSAWGGRFVREYVSFGNDPKLREDYGIYTQRVGCWADRTAKGVAKPPALPQRTSVGPQTVEISLDYDLRALAAKAGKPSAAARPRRTKAARPNPGAAVRKICLPVRGYAESSLLGLAEIAADVELDARDVLLVRSFSKGKLCFRPDQRDDIGFALADLANAEDAMATEMTRRRDADSARYARAARDGLTGLAQKVWRS